MKKRTPLASPLLLSLAALTATSAIAQTGTSVEQGDWPVYHGGFSSQRYSPLDQINADNVGSLQIAWRLNTANLSPRPDYTNPSTPLEVDGMLYANVGITRNVVAMDAVTGEIHWVWRPQEGERFDEAPRKGAGRGVAFYRNGDKTRIIDVSPGYHLVSLDAETGIPDPAFGTNGIVDLMVGLRNADDPRYPIPDIGLSAAPFVMNDVIVVGAAHRTGGRPRSKINVKGDIRGFDVHTGELLWTFHTIPMRGEVGYETWLDEGVEFTGNAGVWAPMSGDPDLGIVYLPVEDPTGDYYGGDRPGDNLFSSGLVAVDVKTGQRKWHYQFIHHDIWDWDVPAAPILADLPNGRKIVLSAAKQSWVYAFDRVTGEPIWPIVERPVPAGDVPGEWYSPTQPFPTRPAAFDRQGFSEADLIDWTPEVRALALESIQGFRLMREFYEPPSLAESPDGTRGLLSLPSSTGGANWEGAAMDPETGILYVPSRTQLQVLSLAKNPESDIDFSQAGVRVPRVQGLEVVKPPYGRVTAIDMNTGDHLWWIPNADTPDRIKNHPLLQGVDIDPTGVPTRSGILLTKSLLFVGEGVGAADAGPRMRAVNKQTGEVVAVMDLPGLQTGLPFTYEHGGKQYLGMFVGGGTTPAELIIYALP